MGFEQPLPPDLASTLGRLDELVEKFESHPEAAVQARAEELLRCIDYVHRRGLTRVAELLDSAGLTDQALDVPEIRLLFELYELSERAANESVRMDLPLLAASAPPAGFVPLSSLAVTRRAQPRWLSAFRVDEAPPGSIVGLELAGQWVLVANVDGEYRAYRNACPGTPLPLHGGDVAHATIRCPWHRCLFDLRDGKRVDADAPALEGLPVRVEDGHVQVELVEEPAR